MKAIQQNNGKTRIYYQHTVTTYNQFYGIDIKMKVKTFCVAYGLSRESSVETNTPRWALGNFHSNITNKSFTTAAIGFPWYRLTTCHLKCLSQLNTVCTVNVRVCIGNAAKMPKTITMTSFERHVVSNYQAFDCFLAAFSDPHHRHIKHNIKVRITDPLWGEFPGEGWPAKGPVTRKEDPFDDVIMKFDDEMNSFQIFVSNIIFSVIHASHYTRNNKPLRNDKKFLFKTNFLAYILSTKRYSSGRELP